MLMNHNNFHFTQIPDKINDMIFLKSPKTMSLGHFLSFLPDGIFSKKFGCHILLYMGPEHHVKFQEKTNEPIPRKLTNRRKDGGTDGRTDARPDPIL